MLIRDFVGGGWRRVVVVVLLEIHTLKVVDNRELRIILLIGAVSLFAQTE